MVSEKNDYNGQTFVFLYIGSNRITFNSKNSLDAGIQDTSTSISIVDNLIERCPGTDDESDTHVEARDRRYSCLK